jgi:hypothetical protein
MSGGTIETKSDFVVSSNKKKQEVGQGQDGKRSDTITFGTEVDIDVSFAKRSVPAYTNSFLGAVPF